MKNVSITEELDNLHKDYYILNVTNLLGKKGDVIRVVNSREGFCDIIKADGTPHWFACSIEYCIEEGNVIPFSIDAYVKFDRKLQIENVKQAADDLLNSLIAKNKENRKTLYTEDDLKRIFKLGCKKGRFTTNMNMYMIERWFDQITKSKKIKQKNKTMVKHLNFNDDQLIARIRSEGKSAYAVEKKGEVRNVIGSSLIQVQKKYTGWKASEIDWDEFVKKQKQR